MTRKCKWLDYKEIGLFKTLAKVRRSAYKRNPTAFIRIYNTLHISLLELYNDNTPPS